MTTFLKRTFTILALPTITLVLSYLINVIFNDTVVAILDEFLEGLDRILWSRITNLLLVMVATMLLVTTIKFILKLINGTEKD